MLNNTLNWVWKA